MEDDVYFVFSTGEDGITFEEFKTKKELLAHIKEISEFDDELEFENALIHNTSDPTEWGTSVTIIKGRVIQPKAVEKVTKYEVP